MKIAHVVLALNVGGIECMLADICRKQADIADVSLVIINDTYDRRLLDSISKQVSCVLIRRPCGSRNPWHLLRTLRTLRQLQPDIIHLHHLSMVPLIRMLRFPRITTVHSTLSQAQGYIAAREYLCGISQAVGDTISNVYPNASCAVVTNGVDFSSFTTREVPLSGPVRLLQVSRLLHSCKGQDILLQALRLLRERRGELDLSVTFVGDGPSREYLATLARDLGVEKRCVFLGEQPRTWVYENLHRYDLLVQPSRQEGFGLTIVEAMAAKVPVLVADLPAPMEVIQSGRFGYHFVRADAGSCAERIAQALAEIRQPHYAARLGAAYEYARSSFDISQTVARYFAEYERVIQARESHSRRSRLSLRQG